MSRVDDLIAEHTPNGVEFKILGDIARFVRGNGMPKADLVGKGVGAIHYGQIYTKYGVWATETLSFVTRETAAKLAEAQPGDIIITNTSENVEDVGKAVAWLGAEPIVTGGHATVIQHDLDPKYLAYWFQSESFSIQKRALATGTKVIDVSARQLAKVRLPVPPIEVQREIVRILDKFTRLEAELEAELEARRRQYEHYRQQLLLPNEHTIIRPLGDMVRIKNGRDHKHLRPGDVPVYGSGGVMRYAETASAEGPSVLIPRKGSLGNLFYVDGPFWNVDTIFSTEADTSVIEPKFLFHQLATMRLGEMNQAGGVPSQTQSVLNRLPIPVPPLEDQRRIVGVLDAFDALVNSLSVGLPAELLARRKQLAYYRDKLLTFEETAA